MKIILSLLVSLAVAAGMYVIVIHETTKTLGGSPASSTQFMRIMEQLGFFSALGLVIVFVAAAAWGRILSVASGIKALETAPATETIPAADRVPAHTGRTLTLPFRRARTETVPAESEDTTTVG